MVVFEVCGFWILFSCLFCLSLKRNFFDLADLLYNFVERLLYGVFLLVGEFSRVDGLEAVSLEHGIF